MSFRKLFSALRASGPGTQCFLAMMEFGEADLPRAAKSGDITPEALEYCEGAIEVAVQGKRVSKTRKQWVDYLIGLTREGPGQLFLGSPFHSYDSDRTKAKKLRKALLRLESLKGAQLDGTLDELVETINKDCSGSISISRLATRHR